MDLVINDRIPSSYLVLLLFLSLKSRSYTHAQTRIHLCHHYSMTLTLIFYMKKFRPTEVKWLSHGDSYLNFRTHQQKHLVCLLGTGVLKMSAVCPQLPSLASYRESGTAMLVAQTRPGFFRWCCHPRSTGPRTTQGMHVQCSDACLFTLRRSNHGSFMLSLSGLSI